MLRRLLKHAVLLIILGSILVIPLLKSFGKPEAAASDSPRRPKLIVLLVIDQFRYDYLVRFQPQFVQRGFNLLLSGANFVDCRYDYATTATGPGHATLATGAYPNIHGIIANEWYDRSLHRQVNCVEDPSTKLLDEPGNQGSRAGASPHYLIGSTLGDELRLASGFQSKVVGISLKDRAAILPAGRTANAAYWYNAGLGHFVTSTYYTTELPAWVTRFNEQPPSRAYCGKNWTALPETPSVGGKTLKDFTLEPNERCPDERFLRWIENTPFMNEIELNFALEAVKNESLGRGPATDLLTVSLSVNDYIGHAFGPYSPEVADLVLRTDRDLADFFSGLDDTVGLENVWIALSADHGVAPNPKLIKEHRLGMGNIDPRVIVPTVEMALDKAFGEDRWVESGDEFYVYLNQEAVNRRHLSAADVEAVAAAAVQSVPGVAAAFTRTQLSAGTLGGRPLGRKASNSFHDQRSGDLLVVLAPYAVPVEGDIGTTHGSPWNYDAQVPLVIWGSAFRPGVYSTPCQTIDLTPTFAAALGISQPSGAEGRPLSEAIK